MKRSRRHRRIAGGSFIGADGAGGRASLPQFQTLRRHQRRQWRSPEHEHDRHWFTLARLWTAIPRTWRLLIATASQKQNMPESRRQLIGGRV